MIDTSITPLTAATPPTPAVGSVAYVITSLAMGGAQKVLLELLGSDLHHDQPPPLVISLLKVDGLESAFLALGITPFYVELKKPWQALRNIIRLRTVLRQNKVTLLYSIMHHANLFAVLLRGLCGGGGQPRPALIWSIHDTPLKNLYTRRMHRALLWLTCRLSWVPWRIVLVSERSRERYLELGYPADSLCLIHNGVRQDELDPALLATERASVRDELGLPLDSVLIGSLTRDVPEKDLPTMLAAFAGLVVRRLNVHLLLAGEGLSADNPVLADLLVMQGLEGGLGEHWGRRVHLLGMRQDGRRLTRGLNIATLSSRSEAFPLFIAEAMAAGVPCVATDVGDIGLLMGEYGLRVPAGQPQDLAAAWEQVLAWPESQRNDCMAGGWQRIAHEFSCEKMIHQHRLLYQACQCSNQA